MQNSEHVNLLQKFRAASKEYKLGNYEQCLSLIEQGEALCVENGPLAEELLVAYEVHAGVLRKLGRFEDAQSILARAICLSTQYGLHNSVAHINILVEQGALLCAMQKHEDAIRTLEHAFNLQKQLKISDDVNLLIAKGILVQAYLAQNEWKTARALAQRTYDSSKRLLGKKHTETFLAKGNLELCDAAVGMLKDHSSEEVRFALDQMVKILTSAFEHEKS